MKFGVNLLLWTVTLEKKKLSLLPKIAKMGFEAVEVPLFDIDVIDVEATKAKLEECGLDFLGCSIVATEANPISPKASERRAAVKYLRDRIEITRKLGGPAIAGPMYAPVGYLVGRRRTAAEWKRCVSVLKEVAKIADDNDVNVALEPINRFETYFINTVGDALALIRDVGSPRIKVHFDTFHANIEEKDVAKALKSCGKHLGHVHACENDRGAPGSGHVDWKGVFASLKSLRYRGYVCIESFGSNIKEIAAAAAIWRDLAPSSDVLAQRGLRFLKKMAR